MGHAGCFWGMFHTQNRWPYIRHTPNNVITMSATHAAQINILTPNVAKGIETGMKFTTKFMFKSGSMLFDFTPNSGQWEVSHDRHVWFRFRIASRLILTAMFPKEPEIPPHRNPPHVTKLKPRKNWDGWIHRLFTVVHRIQTILKLPEIAQQWTPEYVPIGINSENKPIAMIPYFHFADLVDTIEGADPDTYTFIIENTRKVCVENQDVILLYLKWVDFLNAEIKLKDDHAFPYELPELWPMFIEAAHFHLDPDKTISDLLRETPPKKNMGEEKGIEWIKTIEQMRAVFKKTPAKPRKAIPIPHVVPRIPQNAGKTPRLPQKLATSMVKAYHDEAGSAEAPHAGSAEEFGGVMEFSDSDEDAPISVSSSDDDAPISVSSSEDDMDVIRNPEIIQHGGGGY
jgi:hypothetical protein